MEYRLLLTNVADGEEREIIVPANKPLEELSVTLKIELGLPFCDYGCHRFLFHGTCYVMNEHLISEPEMRFENNLYVGRYRSSDRARLNKVFTVLGSVITYLQDGEFGQEKVRITLLERIS